jgi:hypothetical protein
MRVKFEGDTIGATSSKYTIEFDFPKLMVMEAPDFAQDTPIPTTIKLKALKADTTPTGMAEPVPYILMDNVVGQLSDYPSA